MRTTVCLMLALCATGCDDTANPQSMDMASSGATHYAIATTLMANTGQATSLIFTAPSLADGPALDESKAISVPEVASIFGIEGSGKVYSTTAMTPVVTEYSVAENGTITPGTQLSFAQFGLGAGFSTRSIAMVSATKAYLLDDRSLQAISFDPSTMTLGKSIDLGGLKEMGYGSTFSYNIPVRGNQVVVTAYYYDQSFSKTIPQTGVALIDSTTDAVTIVKDSRCGAFSTIAQVANGDLYFAQDTYATALNLAGGAASAPEGCLLRMKAGENAFDPGFFVKIKDATGLPGGGVVPGKGNTIWVRGFDASLFPIAAGTTTAIQILGAVAWKWFRIDGANPMAQAVASSVAPSGGQLNYSVTDGKAYVGNPSADLMTTTLLDMTSSEMPAKAANMMGRTKSIVRVR
jgi:hypothetical protein